MIISWYFCKSIVINFLPFLIMSENIMIIIFFVWNGASYHNHGANINRNPRNEGGNSQQGQLRILRIYKNFNHPMSGGKRFTVNKVFLQQTDTHWVALSLASLPGATDTHTRSIRLFQETYLFCVALYY